MRQTLSSRLYEVVYTCLSGSQSCISKKNAFLCFHFFRKQNFFSSLLENKYFVWFLFLSVSISNRQFVCSIVITISVFVFFFSLLLLLVRFVCFVAFYRNAYVLKAKQLLPVVIMLAVISIFPPTFFFFCWFVCWGWFNENKSCVKVLHLCSILACRNTSDIFNTTTQHELENETSKCNFHFIFSTPGSLKVLH